MYVCFIWRFAWIRFSGYMAKLMITGSKSMGGLGYGYIFRNLHVVCGLVGLFLFFRVFGFFAFFVFDNNKWYFYILIKI